MPKGVRDGSDLGHPDTSGSGLTGGVPKPLKKGVRGTPLGPFSPFGTPFLTPFGRVRPGGPNPWHLCAPGVHWHLNIPLYGPLGIPRDIRCSHHSHQVSRGRENLQKGCQKRSIFGTVGPIFDPSDSGIDRFRPLFDPFWTPF